MRRKRSAYLFGTIVVAVGLHAVAPRPDPNAEMRAAVPRFRFLHHNESYDRFFPSSWSESTNYRRDGADLQVQLAYARQALPSSVWRETPIPGGGAAFVRSARNPIKPTVVATTLLRPLRRYLPESNWMLRIYPKDGGVGVDLFHSVDR